MTGRQDLFQQAMNQGHSAAWDQHWDQAVDFYRRALQEFPEHPKALTSLGLALLELNEYDHALECYQTAAKAQPQDPLPVEKVAQICERTGRLDEAAAASLWTAGLYMKQNDTDRAIENWNRAIRCDPHSLPGHSRLAVVYDRLGRKAEAVSEYLATAALLQRAGDRPKATQALERALLLQPKNSEAHRGMAMLKNGQQLPLPTPSRSAGASQRVARVWQKRNGQSETAQVASEQDPVADAQQRAMLQLADLLFEQSETGLGAGQSARRGITEITRNLNSVPSEQTAQARILLHLGQAIDAQTQNQLPQAIQELEEAIKAGLSHPGVYFNLGLLYSQQNQPEAALAHLQQAVKNRSYALAAHLVMGQTQHKCGKNKEAAIQYLEALKIADSLVVAPEAADALRQLYDPLIEVEAKGADEKRLLDICENVSSLLLRPDWKVTVAEGRLQLPEPAENAPAIPLAELLLQTSSSQLIESLTSIQALTQAGKRRSAVEEAYFALQYAPTYLPLHIQIGELLLAEQRQPEAIEKFGIVARAYSVRGETSSAATLLQRIIQLSPQDLEARSRLVSLLADSGQTDEALRAYLDLASLHYSLAEMDKARSIFTAALRLAQQSSKARQWSIQILNRIGDIDMQRLDWRQAARIFEQVRSLQPSDLKTRATLIDLNFRMGLDSPAMADLHSLLEQQTLAGQVPQAIEMLAGLIQEHPRRVELRQCLADLYRQAGRTIDAVAELDEIANLLLKAGDKAGAVAAIQALLELKPPEEAGYRRLLEQILNSEK